MTNTQLQGSMLLNMLIKINRHADRKLGGGGEMRRMSIEEIDNPQDYERERVRSVPGTSYVLIYNSHFAGQILYYHLKDNQYLRVVNA